MTDGQSHRSVEALRQLWNADVSQALWEAIGGLERVQQAQVLFAFVRQHSKDSYQARVLLARPEAFKDFVRGVWRAAETSSAPRRSRQNKQSADQHSDAMQVVSRLFTCHGEADWSADSWEDGVPRIASGVASRVDRLRALGNACVPQVVEAIGRAILQADEAP
jgi:hypothetical protein